MAPRWAAFGCLGLALVAGCSGGRASSPGDGGETRRDAASDAAVFGSPDGGTSSDDAGAVDAAAACGVLGGPHRDVTCARSSGGFATELAIILDDVTAPKLRILSYGLGGGGACSVADHVEVTTPLGVALASFDAGGAPLTLGNGGWLEGPATAAAATFCTHDDARLDAVRLVLTGRSEGASFTTTCGGESGGWPPSLVVTCHRGIPPSRPIAGVTIDASRTSLQTWVPSAREMTLTAVDPTVSVLSATFGGAMPTTQVTAGWALQIWGAVPGTMHATPFEYTLQIGTPSDVLGALCVPRGGMPPTIGPAALFRVTGTTDTGTFSTELYVEGCTRP